MALGAITTIALAWGCAALLDPHRGPTSVQREPRPDGSTVVTVTHRRFGHQRINSAVCQELVIDEATGSIRVARWSGGSTEARSETRAGWPWPGFRCANRDGVAIVLGDSWMEVMSVSSTPVPEGWLLAPFAPPPRGPVAWRAVPLRPIWTGLLLNTIALAALWLALLLCMRAGRRAIRRHRGLCPRCAHHLRASGIAHAHCPECGETIRDERPPGA